MTADFTLPCPVASFREHAAELGHDAAFVVMATVIMDGGGRSDYMRVKALQDVIQAYAEDTGKAGFAWLGDARRACEADGSIERC